MPSQTAIKAAFSPGRSQSFLRTQPTDPSHSYARSKQGCKQKPRTVTLHSTRVRDASFTTDSTLKGSWMSS